MLMLLFQNNITPRFEFGFGLSYTTFNYTNLGIQKVGPELDGDAEAGWDAGQPTAMGQGSSAALWCVLLRWRLRLEQFVLTNLPQAASTCV